MTDESTDIQRQTSVAVCAAPSGTAPYTVHGVAIGEDEVTMGRNGPKFWPASELRAAAQTLAGVPLNKNHEDKKVEALVGEVVNAGYEDGIGVVFEAEVDDEEIATMIHRGRLDVSIHAIHTDGGVNDDGQQVAENIRFLDLSVVPRGAAQSNTVQTGPSEALASLDTDTLSDMLNSEPATDDDSTTDDGTSTLADSSMDNDTTEASMTENEQELADEADSADGADAPVDTEVDEELEDDVEEDVEDEELEETTEETEAETEEPSDVEDVEDSEVAELREQIAELETENEALREEVQEVALEYADAVAGDSVFTAEELAAKFSLEELKAKYTESDEAVLTASETTEETSTPDVQTGASEDELSTVDEPDETAERIEELEAKIEQYRNAGWEGAVEQFESELAELRE